MRAGGGFILGGVATFAVIHAFNFLSPPIPEQKVHTIEVPKVIREPAPEPKTIIETKKLPDSCETVLDALDLYLADANRVERDGVEIKNLLTDLGPAKLHDPNAVYEYQVLVNKHVATMGENLHDLLENNASMKFRLEKCRNEIEKSNAGEDVARSDSISGVVPY